MTVNGFLGYVWGSEWRLAVPIMPYNGDPSVFQGRGRMSGKSVDIARTVLMEPGSSYTKVGMRFGVTRQRVGQIAIRMGVGRIKRIHESE